MRILINRKLNKSQYLALIVHYSLSYKHYVRKRNIASTNICIHQYFENIAVYLSAHDIMTVISRNSTESSANKIINIFYLSLGLS